MYDLLLAAGFLSVVFLPLAAARLYQYYDENVGAFASQRGTSVARMPHSIS